MYLVLLAHVQGYSGVTERVQQILARRLAPLSSEEHLRARTVQSSEKEVQK